MGLSWLLYPVFTLVSKIDPLNSIFSILIFNCLLIGLIRYKNIIEEVKSECISKLEKREADRNKSSEEFNRLSAYEIEVTEKELAVIKLYEITKKMSEGLKFDSIFNIFSAFLKENFIFRKCELIILRQADGSLRSDRTYKVWGRSEGERSELSRGSGNTDYNGIVKLCSESAKEVYLTRYKDEATLKKMRIDDEVSTFIAVPLLSEKKMAGVLTVENLPDIDREKFAILATQFALELKKVLLYETVEELAITDSLTGLYVRRYFFERLKEELARSKRYKFKFTFLMIDIDNFKNCNDTYGHLVGDVILKDVGRIMKENVREIDLIARYGGEEFSVILPEAGKEEAKLVAERIRKRIEENIFKAYDETLKITVSIGISSYPDDSAEARGLIEKADKALYAAKSGGKNVVCEYKKEYNSREEL